MDNSIKVIDKNYFEELVDNLMIEKYSDDKETTDYINSLPKENKRVAILSLLMGDNNMWLELKSLISDNNLNRMEHIKDVITMLREYVKKGDVEQKKFGEVMTPLEFVKEMVSVLPEETWSNPNLKILDPANGTGPYPIMVIYKLMVGLESWEPNEELRYKHIVENMIYVCEIQPRNMFLYMCAVDPWDKYSLNVYTGSFLDNNFDKHMKDIWNISRFDIVIGNPPYQDELIAKKGSAKPLYNLFTEKSINISEKILFVTPSRWFAGGKGLDSFRKMMIESSKLKLIIHNDDATDIFGKSVDITGGVSYFIFDNNYKGECLFDNVSVNLSKYDIIVNPKYYSIIDKVSKFDGLEKICKGQSYSGITTNDSRLSDTKLNDNQIKCYVSKVNGYEKWIDIDQVRESIDLNKWKVITARANGSYPKFGNKFMGYPNEVCNQSYICFELDSELESKNLIKYIDTKFANFLLSIRKISQDLKPDTCKWIPYIDLNKEWSDSDLSIFFNLTPDEKFIIGI
jgi:site-specific DNA-methyltransferase (adenine-specific)